MNVRARRSWTSNVLVGLSLVALAGMVSVASHALDVSARRAIAADLPVPSIITGECTNDPDCDDSNDCTVDQCIDNTCLYTDEPNDTPCPDGLFCNGDETCQTGVCTDQVDPCVDEAHCDEDADVCLDCVDNAECDDSNDCTLDECIANACVNTPVADDTSCPDGLFCNGDETCQTGVCTDQADPCVDEAHCDEDADVCLDCVDNAECDDSNDCTLDECIADVCVNTPVADDTPCPDGLFCNGDETCQTGVCTDQADPCVDEAHCDEDADVCLDCVDNAECDDSNDCTLDECIADVCVNTPVADDTPCPDGLFCNGDETCQTGVCTDQADPCVDEAHCDEETDSCIDCLQLGDSDSDGVVGPLDFALMFDCRTEPVGPIDPPAYEEGCVCFDFDEDGDVDLEDYAAFQIVFEHLSFVSIALVALTMPGAEDEVSELPVGDKEFPVGESFFIEIWARTNEADGLASVYVDVLFDPAALNAQAIIHTVLFNLFQLGTIDNETGLIREVGGSHLGARGCEDPIGVAPGWARVAVLEMRAEAKGVSIVESAGTGSPFTISICGRFERPVATYGDVAVTIVEP